MMSIPTRSNSVVATLLYSIPCRSESQVMYAVSAPASASISAKIGYLYKYWRNKIITSANTIELYNDAGDTVDQKSAISDDGSDFTRGEIETGP